MINKNKFEREYFSNDFNNWLNNDYYHLLGIDPAASLNEINRAFRIKLKGCNPSLYTDSTEQKFYTEERLKQLISARDTLTDKVKREQYDNERQLSQECYISYISSTSNIFEKDKKIISPHRIKEVPGKKLERLKKYVSTESQAYHKITQSLVEQISDIFLLCMSEHDYQQ